MFFSEMIKKNNGNIERNNRMKKEESTIINGIQPAGEI